MFEVSIETLEWRTSQFHLSNLITEQLHTQPP
jgi:hypothetical protein